MFSDPDRAAVKALGLEQLPAFVFIRVDGTVPAAAEGWDPAEWREVAEAIAEATAWSRPTIPAPGDPGPFHGSPALALTTRGVAVRSPTSRSSRSSSRCAPPCGRPGGRSSSPRRERARRRSSRSPCSTSRGSATGGS